MMQRVEQAGPMWVGASLVCIVFILVQNLCFNNSSSKGRTCSIGQLRLEQKDLFSLKSMLFLAAYFMRVYHAKGFFSIFFHIAFFKYVKYPVMLTKDFDAFGCWLFWDHEFNSCLGHHSHQLEMHAYHFALYSPSQYVLPEDQRDVKQYFTYKNERDFNYKWYKNNDCIYLLVRTQGMMYLKIKK